MKLRAPLLRLAIVIGVSLSLPVKAKGPAGAPRIALIVGNANYRALFGALTNPVNDAKIIGQTLRSVDFDVGQAVGWYRVALDGDESATSALAVLRNQALVRPCALLGHRFTVDP